MPLVQQQSQEQLETYTRHNFRRAALGVAACIGSLLGISAAITAGIAHNVGQKQKSLEEYLQPSHREPAVYHHVSQQKLTAEERQDNSQWPITLHIESQPPKPHNKPVEWALPLGAIGGVSVVGLAGLVTLGAGIRRRRESYDTPVTDVETLPERGLYDFERQNLVEDAQRDLDDTKTVQDMCTALEECIDQAEREKLAELIAARLGSELNVIHMHVLKDMAESPLKALNYSCTSTFYEQLSRGESVADACQPIWPAQQ